MTTAPAPKPLPKSVQYVILVVMLGGVGAALWWVRPSTVPCTVKETFRNSNICVVTATLKGIDSTNKDLNAKRIGSTELDEVQMVDASGVRSVYFDPKKFNLGERTSARVTGREVQERGSGVMRFMVQAVE